MIDRVDLLLKTERQRTHLHGLSTTKPGTLLTDAVPIRTFADWDDAQPGFTEIDLVAHCGSAVKGDYRYTLTVTDISPGWTECLAVRNRGQQAVFQAIIRLLARLPFPLKGLDSDNGVEFLNSHPVSYCQQESLTLNLLARLPQMRRLQAALWELALSEKESRILPGLCTLFRRP